MYKKIDKQRRTANPALKDQPGQIDHFASNMNMILVIGGDHREGFDATRYPSGIGRFDRIIFENPHTGSYGSDHDETKNLAAVEGNTEFLKGIMDQAHKHLTSTGVLEITVCGWPYIAKPGRNEKWSKGMDLLDPAKAEALAEKKHLKYVDVKSLGQKQVERNDGHHFTAHAYRLRFRKESH